MVVDGEDVRVGQGGHGPHLGAERQELGALQGAAADLDGDGASGHRVSAAPDGSRGSTPHGAIEEDGTDLTHGPSIRQGGGALYRRGSLP